MISSVVYTSILCIIAPTLAFPVSTPGDSSFGFPKKQFEIVEGPREFMLPLVPLSDIFLPTKDREIDQDSQKPSKSDLDYMVYGKLYLMKAMSSTTFGEKPKENNMEPGLSDRSVLSSGQTEREGITFPAHLNQAKRPYRYKVWSKLEQSQNGDSNDHASNRRLEERSADITISTENPPLVSSTSTVKAITNIVNTEDSFNLDEEADELIKAFKPESEKIDEPLGKNNASKISLPQGSENGSTTNSDDFSIDNRFLINVPSKPLAQCPEGQRRTHRGVCKPILRTVPNDGGLAGSSMRNEQSVPSVHGRLDQFKNLQIANLFRSVVQFEKFLEKTLKDTERQLAAVVRDEETSTAATVQDIKQE